MTGDDWTRMPTDDELAAERLAVEALVAGAGLELGDPSLWEPSADLEEALLAEAGASTPATPRRRPWRILVAAAVVGIAAVGLVTSLAQRDGDPDWVAALAPTDLAPQASGSIEGWNEASGTRVRLDLANLAPAPEGFFYELWFSEGPIHISAGTFHDIEGVELWAGVTRGDFPRLWITLEPIDGNAAPSPDTVLDTG